jgi:predicted metallo-beta-lactamase superfamily hydrolase
MRVERDSQILADVTATASRLCIVHWWYDHYISDVSEVYLAESGAKILYTMEDQCGTETIGHEDM